jgi:hypothetical protein
MPGQRSASGAATRALQHRLALALGCLLASALFVGRAVAEVRFDLAPERARAFDDASPIRIDLDGDGRDDRLTPRILELRRAFIPGATPFPDGDLERYVAFALDTAAGRSVGTVLQFRFGTENGGYRQYLVDAVGDADGDGRGDLAVQVGGELPAETIVLLDRGERFSPRSSGRLRCACAVDEGLRLVTRERDGERRVIGRWDGARGRFVGDEVVWVIGASAVLRDGLTATSAVIAEIPGGTALRRLAPDAAAPPGWLAVALDGRAGWISRRVVESESPAASD